MTLASAMPDPAPAETVAVVRRFSRFYTRRIGLLHEGYLGSPFSLAEGRVIYELGRHGTATAAELAAGLDLDQGYLSRILRGFDRRGLLRREPSATDRRQMKLSLTPAGQEAFAALDARSRDEIGAMLAGLSVPQRNRLAAALREAEALLGGTGTDPAEPWLLRPPRAGDMGWVVHRHGVLYAVEYDWDQTFEALVAEIVAKFVQTFDARRERCWIAERAGEIVGSVFVARKSEEVAQLRLLYVEPAARGHGIGRRLVDECVRFARETGYRRIMLWTNDVLVSARRIYQAAGFTLTAEERHHSFGKDLVGQTWERPL
jgi:DNA-binding MarR family transcriptional regulator/N-acetylglutamate synthase-like GNAT family acetyltransferase